MKIEIHNALQNPQLLEVTRVLVLDEHENPLVVAVEVESGIIIVETADNEAKFNALLRGLGIDKTVIVHDAKQRPLHEIQIPRV